MNITLAVTLTVLAVLLNATRDVPPNARTARQIWDTARGKGWRGALIGVGMVAVALGIAFGCLLILALFLVVRLLEGARVVAGAVGWHLCDLIGWAPVRLVEA